MPYPTPNPSPSSAGTSDAQYIRMLRDFVEDMPNFSKETTSANGSDTEYRCTDFPIYDGDPYNDVSKRYTVTVGGTTQTLIDSRNDLTAVNQVVVDYENGWLYWHPTYPPQGQIVIRKSKVRFRDERLLEALYGGLRAIFPYCWQFQTDTSIAMQVLLWEYTLPPVFWDPRVRITDVEILDIPFNVNRYHRIEGWRRGALNTIIVPSSQRFVPGAQLRIKYAGPYKALSDLPEQETQLPLLWAKGYLLSNKEIARVRQDTANVTQDQHANPVGSSQNAGAFFFSLFEKELARLARPLPMTPALLTYSR